MAAVVTLCVVGFWVTGWVLVRQACVKLGCIAAAPQQPAPPWQGFRDWLRMPKRRNPARLKPKPLPPKPGINITKLDRRSARYLEPVEDDVDYDVVKQQRVANLCIVCQNITKLEQKLTALSPSSEDRFWAVMKHGPAGAVETWNKNAEAMRRLRHDLGELQKDKANLERLIKMQARDQIGISSNLEISPAARTAGVIELLAASWVIVAIAVLAGRARLRRLLGVLFDYDRHFEQPLLLAM